MQRKPTTFLRSSLKKDFAGTSSCSVVESKELSGMPLEGGRDSPAAAVEVPGTLRVCQTTKAVSRHMKFVTSSQEEEEQLLNEAANVTSD